MSTLPCVVFIYIYIYNYSCYLFLIDLIVFFLIALFPPIKSTFIPFRILPLTRLCIWSFFHPFLKVCLLCRTCLRDFVFQISSFSSSGCINLSSSVTPRTIIFSTLFIDPKSNTFRNLIIPETKTNLSLSFGHFLKILWLYLIENEIL